MSGRSAFRIVVFREGPVWIAQACDDDICAQGESLSVAIENLGRVMRETYWYIEQKGVERTSSPAPDKFFEAAAMGVLPQQGRGK